MFVPSSLLRGVCNEFARLSLGSEGNLEIIGGSQGYRQQVSMWYEVIPLQPNQEKR